MIKKYLLLVVVSSILLFTGCDDKKDLTENKIVPKKETYINLSLLTTDAKAIRVVIEDDKWIFKGYENKVILLNFFATWCPPCQAEIPHLINLQNKYKDNFNVISILIEPNQSNAKIKKFIKKYNINYTIVNSDENIKISQLIGMGKIIPTMYMIDINGKIIEKYVGAIPEEMLEIDIKKGLGEL